MTTLYAKIDEADWSFVGTWVEKAARDAALQVHSRNGLGHSDELDDLEQHALLYVGTHMGAVSKIRTEDTLRRHIYSRLVQDFRRDWERGAEMDHYGTETELYEGGDWDV